MIMERVLLTLVLVFSNIALIYSTISGTELSGKVISGITLILLDVWIIKEYLRVYRSRFQEIFKYEIEVALYGYIFLKKKKPDFNKMFWRELREVNSGTVPARPLTEMRIIQEVTGQLRHLEKLTECSNFCSGCFLKLRLEYPKSELRLTGQYPSGIMA